MAGVHELRSKVPESEKITINLGHVDLGHVDLLVRDGFYSNRSDFIRTAIRNLLARHEDTSKTLVARQELDLGLRTFTRDELEAAKRARDPIAIRVLGLAIIASDVTPELARTAISSVQVLGTLQASVEVKAALRDRLV